MQGRPGVRHDDVVPAFWHDRLRTCVSPETRDVTHASRPELAEQCHPGYESTGAVHGTRTCWYAELCTFLRARHREHAERRARGLLSALTYGGPVMAPRKAGSRAPCVPDKERPQVAAAAMAF